MANTFTAIAPVLYSAAQEVSNEPTGVLQAIDMRFDDKGVAFGVDGIEPYGGIFEWRLHFCKDRDASMFLENL